MDWLSGLFCSRDGLAHPSIMKVINRRRNPVSRCNAQGQTYTPRCLYPQLSPTTERRLVPLPPTTPELAALDLFVSVVRSAGRDRKAFGMSMTRTPHWAATNPLNRISSTGKKGIWNMV